VADEHLYVVTYDIADDKRWRQVFKLMHGYGEWMQLSVFQCRLTQARFVEMQQLLTAAMSLSEDHVLLIDLGPADAVKPRVRSIGKRGYDPLAREPVIV
jgi:CRISPR-associated protein Cas2